MRVHVSLCVSLTRTGALPPVHGPRFGPRDQPQPITARRCGRAPAHARARSVRII